MPEVNTQTQTKTDAQTPAKQMDAKAILARFKQLEEKSTRTGVQISNDDLERIIEPVMKAENDPVPVKMISALVDEILKAEGKIPADHKNTYNRVRSFFEAKSSPYHLEIVDGTSCVFAGPAEAETVEDEN